MTYDPLSDVLRSVRLIGGVFLDAKFTAPWCVSANLKASTAAPFLTTPAQFLSFHVVTEGRLLIFIDGEPPMEVRAGEIVLLPRNDPHRLASAPGVEAIPAGQLARRPDGEGLAHIVHGGGGDATNIICGFLASEEGFNPLIAALPRLLTVDIGQATSRGWIEASVKYAADELVQGRLASSEAISRLSELLLVEAVRHYSSKLSADDVGWLKGVSDPQIGRAISLIHGDLATPWSAEALAREVSLPANTFAQRFTSTVGMPPAAYLAKWRLKTAQIHLRETRKPIAQIAALVGYASEETFGQAFTQAFGLSPSRWRELRTMTASAAGAFEFGSFRLDEPTRTLQLAAREIALQPLLFDLLVYLIRNRERVISKEELLDTLWPDTTVTDSSLQRGVSILRGVLKQGGMEGAIRNFPSKGYRFVVDARPASSGHIANVVTGSAFGVAR